MAVIDDRRSRRIGHTPGVAVVTDFRFGISLDAAAPRPEWQVAARRVEDLGFDPILVPDHLHHGAPLPALVSAAAPT